MTIVPPAPPAGVTVSPACSTASISEPGAPGTTPPEWKCGRSGTLIVFPPMNGTQPGTDQDSRPIVLFHASLMKLNATRNGKLMKLAMFLNAEPIQPGIFLMKPHASPAASLIQFQALAPALRTVSQ